MPKNRKAATAAAEPSWEDIQAAIKAGKAAKVSPAPMPSPWKVGDRDECPADGGAMTYRDDLVYRGRNSLGLIDVANLRGFACATCPERHWDAQSWDAIVQATERAAPAFDVHAKASTLARGAIGIYFPRDVKEYHQIHAGDDVAIQQLAPGLMLVKINHPPGEEPKAPRA